MKRLLVAAFFLLSTASFHAATPVRYTL